MPLSVFLMNDKGILFDPQEVAVAGTPTKLEGDIEKNKEIGAIYGTWGPFFQVSFELIIHSYVKGKGKQGWSSVLAFDKKPSVDLNKNGELRIFFEKKKNLSSPFLFKSTEGFLSKANTLDQPCLPLPFTYE